MEKQHEEDHIYIRKEITRLDLEINILKRDKVDNADIKNMQKDLAVMIADMKENKENVKRLESLFTDSIESNSEFKTNQKYLMEDVKELKESVSKMLATFEIISALMSFGKNHKIITRTMFYTIVIIIVFAFVNVSTGKSITDIIIGLMR
jgi:uncharacterized protein YcbK (DUF882 family)